MSRFNFPARSFPDRLSIASIYLFVLGTLVWRIRGSSDIASDAVDGAASVRIMFDALAGVAALLAIIDTARSKQRPRLRGISPHIGYIVYGFAALLGATQAISPGLVVFRVAEIIIIGMIATAAIWRFTLRDILFHCQAVLLLLAALIALGVVLRPGQAFWPSYGGILPFRLEGAFPLMSYNTVGAIGVFLLAVGLGTDRLRKTTVILGVALIVLAQYRTGYVAAAVVIGVWLLVRPGVLGKVGILMFVPLIVWVVSLPGFAEAWDRGENSSETLSGRTVIWAGAAQVAERSPVVGVGLSSGLRFEVASAVGQKESISTVHGGWMEAYLGTGIIGCTVLLVTALVAFYATWRVRKVSLVPILISAAIAVRTITATSFELPGWPAILFILVAAASWYHYKSEQYELVRERRLRRRPRTPIKTA